MSSRGLARRSVPTPSGSRWPQRPDRGARLVVVNVVDVSLAGRGPRGDLGDAPDVAQSLRVAVLLATLVGATIANRASSEAPLLPPRASLSRRAEEARAHAVSAREAAATRVLASRGLGAC